MSVTWAPPLGKCLCQQKLGANLGPSSIPSERQRERERETNFPPRACAGGGRRPGGGHLLLGINDQGFIWPNSRAEWGILAICQGERAARDFFQGVEFPLQEPKGRKRGPVNQPNPPHPNPSSLVGSNRFSPGLRVRSTCLVWSPPLPAPPPLKVLDPRGVAASSKIFDPGADLWLGKLCGHVTTGSICPATRCLADVSKFQRWIAEIPWLNYSENPYRRVRPK